jgi:hypothetical protein
MTVDEPLADPPKKRSRGFIVLIVAGVVILGFGVIQLVPYRVDNPPVKQEPTWNSPRTRTLAVAACYDCHSNETATYWWEDIAPLSWWITGHVKGGRAKLNFSECTKVSGGHGGGNKAGETILRGSMPPNYYTWLGLHSNAKLTQAEKEQLAAGLDATLSNWNCR